MKGHFCRETSPYIFSDSSQAASQQQQWHLSTLTLCSLNFFNKKKKEKRNSKNSHLFHGVIHLKTRITKDWEKCKCSTFYFLCMKKNPIAKIFCVAVSRCVLLSTIVCHRKQNNTNSISRVIYFFCNDCSFQAKMFSSCMLKQKQKSWRAKVAQGINPLWETHPYQNQWKKKFKP